MKKIFSCHVVAGIAGAAMAQATNPFPDGAQSDPYPTGYTHEDMFDNVAAAPSSGAASYTPDHRPGYIIAAYEGSGNADPLDLGRRGWWRDRTDDGYEMGYSGSQLADVIPPAAGNGGSTASNGIVDAVDMLVALLEQGYALGYRRFIINRPAGFSEDLSSGVGDLPNACWWSLDEELREDLADDADAASSGDGSAGGLAWWIDNHTDATVGIYVGFRAGDPWSTLHSVEPLDADRRSDVWSMYRNIKPWADLGVTEFVFDHVGGITDNEPEAEDRSDSLHRLRAHAAFSGLHIIGEHPVMTKIPSGGGYADSGDLDEDRVEDNPWLILVERLLFPSVDADEQWDITSITGEIDVWLDYSSSAAYRDFDREQIASIVDRGFTAWSAGASRLSVSDESVEMIRWVYYDDYSTPTLTPSCLADLDMDGDVDDDDGMIVYDYVAYGGYPTPVRPWYGDLDVDGDIDATDWSIWYGLATTAGYTSGNSVNCP